MTGNISYLFNFKEINGGYVAFGGNPKGGKITSKGKIKTGKLDFNDVYCVKELKFNLFSVSQMRDKKNSVLFTNTECVVLSSDFKLPDENHMLLRVPRENNMYNEAKYAQKYVLPPLWSTGTKDSQNTDADVAFDDKENESEVHVSLSSSAKPKKLNEKAKREAKGKSHVDFSTGVRDLRDRFEEFFVKSTNEVNAASTPVTVVRTNSTTHTNSFNAVGPSDSAVSPNFEIGRKSSFVDPSLYPDDPDMPALKDIVYSDDEEDVGAEADFSNLEKRITFTPQIRSMTRMVKEQGGLTQINDEDFHTSPQIRSMTRMVKEQGRLTQINDEDFHTCMFACFLYQEESKRVHQALKDPSWIETMQKELFQFKMQKVWVLVDLPKGKRAIGSKWVIRNMKKGLSSGIKLGLLHRDILRKKA
nr:ribonuclease H-like domain-containing protein [Tanacetum cinerariifolium]